MERVDPVALLLDNVDDWNSWLFRHRQQNWPIGPNLQGVDLSDRDLSGVNLTYCDLRGAKIAGANLGEAILTETRFDGANLDRVNLRKARAVGAKFNKASLRFADLRESTLSQSPAQRSPYVDSADAIPDTVFIGADLEQADLRNVDCTCTVFADARLCRANLSNGRFSRANFHEADLTECDLSFANLERADCRLAVFSTANADNTNLQLDNLSGAVGLTRNFLRGAKLTDQTTLPEYARSLVEA